MKKAEKIELTKELKNDFDAAKGLFIADYRGLSVEKITRLRFALHKSKTKLRVVKNRLALKALEGSPAVDQIKTHLDFMSAVAIANGDVAAAAKALTEFAKENEQLKIRAGLLEGKVLDLNQVKALSKLPSREELLAKLLGALQGVPAGFVRVLNGVPSKWVYLLEAIRRQKEQKG